MRRLRRLAVEAAQQYIIAQLEAGRRFRRIQGKDGIERPGIGGGQQAPQVIVPRALRQGGWWQTTTGQIEAIDTTEIRCLALRWGESALDGR